MMLTITHLYVTRQTGCHKNSQCKMHTDVEFHDIIQNKYGRINSGIIVK